MIHQSTYRRAFSLVELSIVLVILGLLVGGILSGRSLIRASELRGLTKQHEQYYSAVMSFRDKYFALPGDMTNATQFWGAAAAPGACAATIGTGTQTCDGNGDSQIELNAGSREDYRLWQQLANAGLIEGSFDGTSQYPSSKLGGNSYVGYYYMLPVSGSVRFYDGEYRNTFSAYNIMIPEEVWNIDTKMDDGKPGAGKLVVYDNVGNFPAGGCSNGTSSADLAASYKLDVTTPACRPFWRMEF